MKEWIALIAAIIALVANGLNLIYVNHRIGEQEKKIEKSATSGKAGGLKKVEPLKAVRYCEPLKAVRL